MWTLRRPATEDTTDSYRQLQRPRYCLWGTTRTDADRWHRIRCRSASVLVRQSAVGVTLWSGWVPPWSAWRLLCLIRGYKFLYTIRHLPQRSEGEKSINLVPHRKTIKSQNFIGLCEQNRSSVQTALVNSTYDKLGGSSVKKPKSKLTCFVNKYRNRLHSQTWMKDVTKCPNNIA